MCKLREYENMLESQYSSYVEYVEDYNNLLDGLHNDEHKKMKENFSGIDVICAFETIDVYSKEYVDIIKKAYLNGDITMLGETIKNLIEEYLNEESKSRAEDYLSRIQEEGNMK